MQPTQDRVIIKLDKPEEKSAGGIFLPVQLKNKPDSGTVQAVGKGKYAEQTGTFIPVSILVGEKVFIPKGAGQSIGEPDENLIILSETQILYKDV